MVSRTILHRAEQPVHNYRCHVLRELYSHEIRICLCKTSALLVFCLSRTEITRGADGISGSSLKRSVPGSFDPLHTKNGSWEHLSSPSRVLVPYPGVSHGGCGQERERRSTFTHSEGSRPPPRASHAPIKRLPAAGFHQGVSGSTVHTSLSGLAWGSGKCHCNYRTGP